MLELLAEGLPTRYERTHMAADIHAAHAGLEPGTVTDEEVSVAGRVMLRRSFGKLLFFTVQDMSGTIQLFVDKGLIGEDAFRRAEMIDLGDWVGAEGVVMTTKKGELPCGRARSPSSRVAAPLPDKARLTDVEARLPPHPT